MIQSLQRQIFKKSLKFTNSSHKTIKKCFSIKVSDFKIYTEKDDHTNNELDPFIISTQTGFLPRQDPVMDLPKEFAALNTILDDMRWYKPDNTLGLLSKNQLGDAVKSSLPLLDVDVVKDKMTQIALFRDYSFLASAYLLEPCHHNYIKTGSYGLAHSTLPKNISVPLVKIAAKLNYKPFLEYNSGYSLNNYYRLDKNDTPKINNIAIKRSFINLKSESGFILVHVSINQHSGYLIQSIDRVLKAVETKERTKFNEALIEMRNCMNFMNQEFERMYFESNPLDYAVFRTFIMGITNQPMFPNGVVYENCFEEKPQFFRGESGANDSVIPVCDNILEITAKLPKNPLTDILRDFRTYRPNEHQKYLSFTETISKQLGVNEFARQDPISHLHLIEIADQVRAFRHRHWVLTNLYIINLSSHPVATGGSPIVTWLPNQLLTVIDYIKENAAQIKERSLPSHFKYTLDAILKRASSEENMIKRNTESNINKFKGQRLETLKN